MAEKVKNIDQLISENEELKNKLYEAESLIDAIHQGGIDALVVNENGKPTLYSLETADYTYRVLIEKFGEGALSISERGVILYCNDYFSKLIDVPAQKIIGTYFSSYVDSVGQFKALQDNLKSGLSKGEIVLNVNDKKIPVYVSLTDLQPTIPAIGIIVTDMSEKRKHEEDIALYQRSLVRKISELNETNERLEQFIHVISHDIKEPVRKILTYASHLIMSLVATEEGSVSHDLRIINSSAMRLNALVEDLVQYSLTSSLEGFVYVDLDEIIKDVLEDLELTIKENAAVIAFESLPGVTGSKTQLRQLFSNIISNALKFKKAGTPPQIKITTEVTDCIDPDFPNKKFYKISIHDNGIGMGEVYLKKIFIIFQRLHMPEEYSGNGVGLAICKKIMENHRGKIDAESKPGKGSTFNLYLPVKY